MVNTYPFDHDAMARAIGRSVMRARTAGIAATVVHALKDDSDELLVEARDAFNALIPPVQEALIKALARVQFRIDCAIPIQQGLALAIYHCFFTIGTEYGITAEHLPDYVREQIDSGAFLGLHEAIFNEAAPVVRLPSGTYGATIAHLKGKRSRMLCLHRLRLLMIRR
jgi:hypothetical protein